MPKSRELLIGAHTSTAGGLHNALYEGQKIGASTVQIFTSNQRQWTPRALSPEIIQEWEKAKDETGIQTVMSHGSYLINLGSPKEEVFQKSQSAFRAELERCLELGITYMNFHPGSHLDDSPEAALDRIVASLRAFEPVLAGSPLTLLLESTAGQGSNLGWKFEELAYILDRCEDVLPIGVCIDTCHSFAAGYDMRSADACDAMLNQFHTIVGLQRLRTFHLNDSLGGLGSRKDRHANLGEGEIGIDSFRFLMQDPRTAALPKYLETPGRLEIWPEEIPLLRQFYDEVQSK